MNCVQCGNKLPKQKQRYCSYDCRRLASNERLKIKKRTQKGQDLILPIPLGRPLVVLDYFERRCETLGCENLGQKTGRKRKADGGEERAALCFGCKKRKNPGWKKCVELECEEPKHSRGRCHRHSDKLTIMGWSEALFQFVWDYQNGRCANEGCRDALLPGPGGHARDHDHDTMEPRALLCGSCNTSLGRLKEDPERIRGLAQYAEQCQNVKLTGGVW